MDGNASVVSVSATRLLLLLAKSTSMDLWSRFLHRCFCKPFRLLSTSAFWASMIYDFCGVAWASMKSFFIFCAASMINGNKRPRLDQPAGVGALGYFRRISSNKVDLILERVRANPSCLHKVRKAINGCLSLIGRN